MLINKRESVSLKDYNDSKVFIKYWNNMNDIYKNIEEWNSNKECKVLIIFDNMFADILSNEKLNLIVTELFIRDRKLKFSLLFIMQSHFAVLKIFRQNSIHHFIMKIPNKSFNKPHLIIPQIDRYYKDFMNLYKNILQNHILF